MKVVGHIAKLKGRPTGGGQELEPGFCGIPCKFAEVYNGQTGLSIKTRYNEHHHHIRLHKSRIRPWRSLALTWGIASCLMNTNILAKKSMRRDRILIKAESPGYTPI
jgi:hypothetical protein